MFIYGGTIYIVTNKSNSTLYIGVTSNLSQRLIEHRERKYHNSFSAKYNCDKLVYFENFTRIEEAIDREKQIKNMKREWKNELIEKLNPKWKDLTEDYLIEFS